MTPNDKILEQALKYQGLGWSVFPVGKDKKPIVKWTRHQTERATPEQIKAWKKQMPGMNLGVATGAVSGLVVLDLDLKHKWTSKRLRELGYHLPPTATARTGNGGEHFFFKHPGVAIPNSQGGLSFGEGVDIRGDGGYFVAAPSVTKYIDEDGKDAGGKYEWIVPPEDGTADMPDWLLQKIQESEDKKEDWQSLMNKDCLEGTRNGAAASIAGGLLGTTAIEKWETVAWPSLQKWNQTHCKPPLSEKELRQVFDSISKKEKEKPQDASASAKSTSKAKELAGLVVGNSDVELFHDEYDAAYARVMVNGHKENLSCKSRKFKLWLTGKIFDKYGSAPTPAVFSTLLSTIESVAILKSKKQELYNRVVRVGDTIWYDLADEKNRAVKITAQGWESVDDPPTLFRREAHQLGQIEPVRGGDAKALFRFVNVTDPEQQLLVLVYLVSCLIPGFPHPLLYIHGQQGSAKSTLSKIIRMLIDPSRTAVLILPKDMKELALQLTRHHLLFYENVSWISPAASDLFCIAVTGGSISKRMLYTDADDFFVNVQTNIGINGINIAAVQPDLLERTILLGLDRVEDGNRKNEQELYAEFEHERPKILGALFDAAAKALSTRPNMVLGTLPRMADFTQWGAAIAEAFGYTKEEFLRVYTAKIREQSDEAIEASTEATALIRFMADLEEPVWHDEPSRLLAELKKTVRSSDAEFAYGEELPKKASQLMKRLNVLRPNLRVAGLELFSKKVEGRRHTFVRKMGTKAAQSVPADSAPQLEGKTMDDMWDDIGQDNPPSAPDTALNLSPKDGEDDVDDKKQEELPF